MTTMNTTPSTPVAVVGGGPVGLACAIALAQSGVVTTLIARRTPYADNRTTALLGGSVSFLKSLGVWQRCSAEAAALRVMRLVDDTKRLIRSPEVRFSSDEIGLDTFGYNIANHILLTAMEDRAAELKNLTRVDADAKSIVTGEDTVTITTSDGHALNAALVAGADGRHSLCREAAGINVKRRDLGQSALTLNISHSRPHNNCSTEFHTENGPCVFVPLPGNNSSIVWVTTPREAERLKAMSDEQLGEVVEAQSHSILGVVTVLPGRHVFPLAIETPEYLAARRVAFVGEAAHVLPPIGAQGLNMGLRDADDLAQIVHDVSMNGGDPGSNAVLQRYARDRGADIASRTIAVDMANRTLLSDFLPVQSLRAAGLHALNTIGPIRRLAIRQGLSPRSVSRS